jgi:hypothetical protein
MSPTYFTNIGVAGPVRSGQLPGSIGVLESLDNKMSIGIASEVGRTGGGLSVWRLCVHWAQVPGQWVMVDWEFTAIPGRARAVVASSIRAVARD